ncbi:hypothetical protein NDU88_004884 [Pleurodeles waltl]|uniref:Uncharacterized protein n=1 Tax=Pleurodeles waltl TaxID=8319 RepID=A0AAV7TSJ6_PLEWA|nr:hypothetical protein NDU88_004884 [Pleurodeles waltl]
MPPKKRGVEGGRRSPPFCLFSPILLSAGSARIEARSFCSVRGLAGRVGEEVEQSTAPGCRGPERADPALGPPAPPVSRGPETTGRHSPPLTCFRFCVQGAALSGASSTPPESRDWDGAASSTFSSDSAAPLFQGRPGGRHASQLLMRPVRGRPPGSVGQPRVGAPFSRVRLGGHLGSSPPISYL